MLRSNCWFLLCAGLLIAIRETSATDDVVILVQSAGYQCESHRVETDDGYVLTMHRILPKESAAVPKNGPVFMMHSMFGSSSDFVISGPGVALAYLMSDKGYDVWLGNARGNRYSSIHTSYYPESKKYWSFSWNEIGYYDLPAMFNYMLMTTARPAAYFIGHSQGSTALLVMLTTRPEYNDKVIQAHLMATPAHMYNVTRTVAALLDTDITWDISKGVVAYKSPSILYVAEVLEEIFCNSEMLITPKLCQNILFMLLDRTSGAIDIDLTTLAMIPQHVSPFVSLMQIRHFVQIIKSGKFRRYDHKLKNQQFYNSLEPPNYDLRIIHAPIYLYHGAQDILISRVDSDVLRTMIPSVQDYKVLENWRHYDFIYSKHARGIVYYDIMKTIDSTCVGWERVTAEKSASLLLAQLFCEIKKRT